MKIEDKFVGLGGAPMRPVTLPTEAAERKQYPLASGVLDYFPDALVALAHLSWKGNQQHNPGQPLHWARGKSNDEADTMLRHFAERGRIDTDGVRHSVKALWRMAAIVQKEIEAANSEQVEQKVDVLPSGAIVPMTDEEWIVPMTDEEWNAVRRGEKTPRQILDDHTPARADHEEDVSRVKDAHGHAHYVPANKMGVSSRDPWPNNDSKTPDDRYQS